MVRRSHFRFFLPEDTSATYLKKLFPFSYTSRKRPADIKDAHVEAHVISFVEYLLRASD